MTDEKIVDNDSIPGNDRGRPAKYDTPDLLANKLDQYFNSCKPEVLTYTDEDGNQVPVMDKGRPATIEHKPTVHGMAVYLGYASPQSLYDIKKRGQGFSLIIEAAISTIASYHEENLYNAGCAGSQFWLKNYAGMKDKTDIELTKREPVDTSKLTDEQKEALIALSGAINKGEEE